MIEWYSYNEASGPQPKCRTIEGIHISLPEEIEEQAAIAEVLRHGR